MSKNQYSTVRQTCTTSAYVLYGCVLQVNRPCSVVCVSIIPRKYALRQIDYDVNATSRRVTILGYDVIASYWWSERNQYPL